MSIKIINSDYKPQKPVIIIGGTTASGKSALAIDLAKSLNGVIINADSMQIYKDLPIISACPSADDMKQTPHKLYQILNHNQECSAGKWCELVATEIKSAWAESKLPIVVGGTGMYIKSLIDGLSPVPDIAEDVRNEVRSLTEQNDTPTLHKLLEDFDPETAARLKANDTQRICRAIEVYKSTKRPLSEWRKQANIKAIPEAEYFIITILPPKDELYPACDARFAEMLKSGAIDEVKNAINNGASDNSAMFNSLGAKQIYAYLQGKMSIKEAEELSCRQTRQYAKRQTTWFKNQIKADLAINHRYDVTNFDTIKENILRFLNGDN